MEEGDVEMAELPPPPPAGNTIHYRSVDAQMRPTRGQPMAARDKVCMGMSLTMLVVVLSMSFSAFVGVMWLLGQHTGKGGGQPVMVTIQAPPDPAVTRALAALTLALADTHASIQARLGGGRWRQATDDRIPLELLWTREWLHYGTVPLGVACGDLGNRTTDCPSMLVTGYRLAPSLGGALVDAYVREGALQGDTLPLGMMVVELPSLWECTACTASPVHLLGWPPEWRSAIETLHLPITAYFGTAVSQREDSAQYDTYVGWLDILPNGTVSLVPSVHAGRNGRDDWLRVTASRIVYFT